MRGLLALAAAAFFAFAFASAPARAAGATTLFSSDDVIEVTITGDIKSLVRTSARSTEPHPATLSERGATYPIELSARGNARRRPENCTFPPLRVKFAEKPSAPSLFAGQKTLKLVTHCRPQGSFQQYTLLEYTAYRMYNALTEAGFRVRLAHVRYVDQKSGKPYVERVGFFIEDLDDLAKRVGMKEVERPEAPASQHDPEAAARAMLFYYMIANHDWSMNYGPQGENCCHNGKLLGPSADATSGLVYVPYDFDYSGFVNTPYAVPPAQLPIKTVRQRYYRGKCGPKAAVVAEARKFRERKDAVLGAIDDTPEMTAATRKDAKKFIEGFFNEIRDDAATDKLAGKCD